MNTFTFQEPDWLIILCILGAIILAAILYWRSDTFRDQSRALRAFLPILRFVAIACIALLLLIPLLRYAQGDIQKPIIVFGLDESLSVQNTLTETSDLDELSADWSDLATSLSDDYQVYTYKFGDEVRPGPSFAFEDKVSDLGRFVQFVADNYANQNLGAVILASDGIFNVGRNPLYTVPELKAPIYSIGLGDTSQVRDIGIRNIFHNNIAYLNDKFEVQVDIQANDAQGSASALLVSKIEGTEVKPLQRIPVTIDDDNFFKTESVILDAIPSGVQRFRFSLTALQNEKNKTNNQREIFVDVLDARQKILVVAHAPHPDLSAIKQLSEINQNNEVEIAYAADFSASLRDYDFVVLHQIPTRSHPAQNILRQIEANKMPHLFILGNQTDVTLFNQAQSILNIQGARLDANEVQARMSPLFNQFIISDAVRTEISQYLPLYAPFGDYEVDPAADVMLYQVIGNIETEFPLLVYHDRDGVKSGILAGEGIWRWKLFNYLNNNNFEVIYELWNQSLQYLSRKEDKRKFRVSLAKNIFDENEPLLFNAELYNESYQLINEPDAFISIIDQAGQEYDFTFDRFRDYYTMNGGVFPPGNYSFSAQTSFRGEQLTHSGKFAVQPIELEYFETMARHDLLRSMSYESGGSFTGLDGIAEIEDAIRNQASIKPVMYQVVRSQSLINLKWFFAIFAFLLCLEWFLRRYFGAY